MLPVTNVSLLSAVILAVIFLKEKVIWPLVAGAVLMAVGAILIAVAKNAPDGLMTKGAETRL